MIIVFPNGSLRVCMWGSILKMASTWEATDCHLGVHCWRLKSINLPFLTCPSVCTDPLLRDYWVYEGSLTIPPCSEGVTWILFRYPLTISQMQVSMCLGVFQSRVLRSDLLPVKGKCLFYALVPVRSVRAFREKLNVVSQESNGAVKDEQNSCSLTVCIRHVTLYRVNRHHCETAWLLISLSIPLCGFFQVWERDSSGNRDCTSQARNHPFLTFRILWCVRACTRSRKRALGNSGSFPDFILMVLGFHTDSLNANESHLWRPTSTGKLRWQCHLGLGV